MHLAFLVALFAGSRAGRNHGHSAGPRTSRMPDVTTSEEALHIIHAVRKRKPKSRTIRQPIPGCERGLNLVQIGSNRVWG